MLRLFSIKYPFLAPDEGAPAGGTPIEDGGLGKEDTIDFLAAEDEPETIPLEDKPRKETKPETNEVPEGEEKPDEDEDEEVDELAEIEDELKEPTEEQLELVTPVRRREILKKYPKLFEDFPYLEKAYYREQQFTEIFSTIQNAKEVAEKSEVLDKFEGDLMSGNSETVLKAVKETNANAFLKLVDDYLPTLAKVDEKAYYHVLGNVTKNTIIAMVQEARRLGVGEGGQGVHLQTAAHLLNQFVFGTSEFEPPQKLAGEEKPQDTSREKQIADREQRFIQQQLNHTRTDLNSRVTNAIKNTIDANIDPNKSMSDYVRKNASRDAMNTLEELIGKDTRFRTLADNLWKKALESNFSRETVDLIRSAYVSKAKTLLPSVIKKARQEALRGSAARRGEEKENNDPKKGPVRKQGAPQPQERRSGKIKEAKDIPAGMSSLEFLSSD